MTVAEETRTRIRCAAREVVAQQGAGKLTLDAVAKDAGVSKGGLLYHYQSKRALLEGMLEDLLLERGALFSSEEKSPDGRAKLKLLIETEFALTTGERAAAQSILAAGAEDPALLDPARNYFKLLFKQIGNGSDDPELSTAVALALQGMQLIETIGLYKFKEEEKLRLKDRLLELVS